MPVWHASVMMVGNLGRPKRAELRRLCYRHLAGVGDMAVEFLEWGGRAYHVKRRLTAAEMAITGPVVDCRGTREATDRLAAMAPYLSGELLAAATAELRLRKWTVETGRLAGSGDRRSNPADRTGLGG